MAIARRGKSGLKSLCRTGRHTPTSWLMSSGTLTGESPLQFLKPRTRTRLENGSFRYLQTRLQVFSKYLFRLISFHSIRKRGCLQKGTLFLLENSFSGCKQGAVRTFYGLPFFFGSFLFGRAKRNEHKKEDILLMHPRIFKLGGALHYRYISPTGFRVPVHHWFF